MNYSQNRSIDSEYFEWFLEMLAYYLGSDDEYDDAPMNYRLLFRALFDYEFTWTNKYDDNRAQDGLDLRQMFIDECLITDPDDLKYLDTKPCSMLEMMFALALRCEKEVMSNPYMGNQTYKWFWLMIQNLGFEQYTDDMMDDEAYNDIFNRLDIVVSRRYKSSGEGGLFPLEHFSKDQRKVEIWYQMQAYMLENYCL